MNFHKSRLIGVNVDETFQKDAAMFLNCKNRDVPFKYLGLPIGVDPRKEGTWQPVLTSSEKGSLHGKEGIPQWADK